MVLKVGNTDDFHITQNMRNLENYLKDRNYGIADFLDKPINSAGGGAFQIQDPTKATKVSRIFKERKVCGIGNVYPQGKEILVRVYGKEYFERLKKDLEVYSQRDAVDITLLLDKEEPEFHFPDRDIGI